MDYVLHQAAIPSVPRSVKDPITSNRANVDASLNVLVAARDAGVKRLVYAGSSSAYGDTPTLPKREDMPPHPLSPYALQKLVAEQYCQMFTRLYGLETVTIRYFNVFGPRQDPGSPYSGVISLFATALLEGRQPTIYGDGEQTRDFTYVANVVDGVLRACEAEDAAGEVINVATAGRISLNQLLDVMNEIVGSHVQPIYKEGRAGDVKDSQADISKAYRLLGYTPVVSFDKGLRYTLDWCRSRPSSQPAIYNMAPRATSWLCGLPSCERRSSHVRLAIRLLREPRVGLLVKALPLLAAVYVVSPLDFVPDVIPVLGQLDDMGILLISIEAFLKLCPAEAVVFHRTAIDDGRRYSPMSATDQVIDAEWRREE